jgi:hypothetical protein
MEDVALLGVALWTLAGKLVCSGLGDAGKLGPVF